MSAGYIYILANPSLQDDYLKIGLTRMDPQARAEEFSADPGVADSYRVVTAEVVPDCEVAQQRVNKRLGSRRVNEAREFFRISEEQAQSVVSSIAKGIRSEIPICCDCTERRHREEMEEECARLREELEARKQKVEETQTHVSELSAALSHDRWQRARDLARRVARSAARLITSPFVRTEQIFARFISDPIERLICTAAVILLVGFTAFIACMLIAPTHTFLALALALVSIAALLVITDPRYSR